METNARRQEKPAARWRTNRALTDGSGEVEVSDRQPWDEFPEWTGQVAEYCELCNQVFQTHSVFWQHRMTSEYDIAREWTTDDEGRETLAHNREITEGEEFPGPLGYAEPCVPTEVDSDD